MGRLAPSRGGCPQRLAPRRPWTPSRAEPTLAKSPGSQAGQGPLAGLWKQVVRGQWSDVRGGSKTSRTVIPGDPPTSSLGQLPHVRPICTYQDWALCRAALNIFQYPSSEGPSSVLGADPHLGGTCRGAGGQAQSPKSEGSPALAGLSGLSRASFPEGRHGVQGRTQCGPGCHDRQLHCLLSADISQGGHVLGSASAPATPQRGGIRTSESDQEHFTAPQALGQGPGLSLLTPAPREARPGLRNSRPPATASPHCTQHPAQQVPRKFVPSNGPRAVRPPHPRPPRPSTDTHGAAVHQGTDVGAVVTMTSPRPLEPRKRMALS